MPSTSQSAAKLIGHVFAYAQHAIDEVIDVGFKTLKKVGDAKEAPESETEHKTLHRIKRAGKGTLKFFGQAGESYFEKYRSLKHQKE